MKKEKNDRLFRLPFSWRDFFVFVAIMVCATCLCWFLRVMDSSGEFATLIYVMAVLLVSRLTNGFLFGLTASVLGVILVNFLFTYPYRAFNFTIAGYPITFLTMLVVSVMTCTLTAQIKQQERLRLENEREKMRANLLRSVSHDIRTPLTSIVGATSTILENSDSLSGGEKQELLEDVRDEAQWLIRVVENLLSITRISGGEQAHITKEPEAAEEVLGEAVRKFRKRFPQVIVTVKAPDTLLMVPMDPILIEQVLANLMENAVIHGKHTTELQISVQQEDSWARFDVKDNGCGIPTSLLPILFLGTRRPAEPSGDKKRNMGLGLVVCNSIVHAHGGTLEARNRPEGGADLIFRLPLKEEEEI